MPELSKIMIKIEDTEKQLWKEHAKKHYGGNMSFMIRQIVSKTIEGQLDTTIQVSDDEKQVDTSYFEFMKKMDAKIDTLAGFITSMMMMENFDVNENLRGNDF
ncbi:MAG: hypothetical protein INQ03_13790 [Candidatus Heimdallarchaeota archaeon]|nr:hypothetical protein [Candidatus Heimdallarchaeota archaeon]